MAKHRATGNPRGRPPKIPFDFGQRIMENLRGRIDPKTGLVRPLWKQMARELGGQPLDHRPFDGRAIRKRRV